MTILWFVAGASLLMALAAWRKARATARRLDQLSQMYWELRYQHDELRAHLRLTSSDAPVGPPSTADSQTAPPAAFVPLSSLKR